MKNRILYLIMALAVAVAAPSCINQEGIPERDSGQTEENGPKGTLKLSELGFSEAVEVTHTRADDPRTAGFQVLIVNTNGREYLNCTVSEMRTQFTNGEIELPVGNYTITVESHKVKNAAWDEPYYFVSKDFEIEKGKTNELEDLVCKLSNIMVSVSFTPEFLEMLTKDDGNVDVYFGTERLSYSVDEKRAGYFKADNDEGEAYESLYWEFSGTVEGDLLKDRGLIKPAKAGLHHILTFDIKKTPLPGEGKVQFKLDVSVEVEVVDLNLNIDVTEEVLEEYNSAVQITSDYKDGQRHVLKQTESGDASLKASFSAEEGLRNVFVTITAEGNDETAAWLTSKKLDETFDLANPGEMEGLLTSYGLPVGAAVKGLERLNIDFAGLLPDLFGFGSTPQVDIAVYVYDSQNNPASATLRFELKDDSVPATIVIEGMDGFILNEPQTLYNTGTNPTVVGVLMQVPNKIAELSCLIVSEFPAFTREGLEDLHLTDDLNLAYPGQYASAIQGLGLPCGEGYDIAYVKEEVDEPDPVEVEKTRVLGKTELNVDISMFVPLITMLYDPDLGDFDVNFVLTVKDELGEEASSTIMFHVVK